MSIIYKTTCLINQKIYIGQSKYNKKEYLGSGKLILKAIKKYGKDSFIKEILIEGDLSKEELDSLEIKYIYEQKSTDVNIGYNIESGGHGNSYLQNIKISESNKGRIISDDTKLKISKSKLGKRASDIARENLSKSKIGNKNRLGKLHSSEDIIKISEGIKNYYNDEDNRTKAKEVAKKRYNEGKCTGLVISKEGQLYATECARLVNIKGILVKNIETCEILEFESLNNCRIYFNIKGNSQLLHCIKNNKIYKRKYIIEYKEKPLN